MYIIWFPVFKVRSLSLVFNNLIIMWLRVDLLVFIFLEGVKLLKCIDLCVLSNLGHFHPVSLNVLSVLWDSHYAYLSRIELGATGLLDSVHFYSLFFLLRRLDYRN